LKRRKFITLLGSAAAWPLMARAQQSPLPVIGFLNTQWPETYAYLAAAFRQGLGDIGYTVGLNVAIEYRWAEGDNDRLPTLAAELVRTGPSVIVANSVAVNAARAATAEITIVFMIAADPVAMGLVQSLNRPGGNTTDVSFLYTASLDPKRMELLHELLPAMRRIGFLRDPTFTDAERQLREMLAGAERLGLDMTVLNASGATEIDAAFSRLVRDGVTGMMVGGGPLFNSRRGQLVALAKQFAVPAISESHEYVAAGGLMSYGPSITELYRQTGAYAGRILKGESPAVLPVMQPTKFELVINMKTAKALGLTVPPTLLALADEVIE
jgi:putative ABC transport system substrate-binding protein